MQAPDLLPLIQIHYLGEVPEVKNFLLVAVLNSIGIGSGGGVGKVTAEWMMTGHINEDIFIYDIKRFQKFHSELGFIKARITEIFRRFIWNALAL